MKAKSERIRWSAEKFRSVEAEQRRSGWTIGEYCRREGINLSSFYRWRDRAGASRRVRRHAVARATPHASDFIALAAPPLSSRLELRFDLGGGIVLTVMR
jgi:hypothetical protein